MFHASWSHATCLPVLHYSFDGVEADAADQESCTSHTHQGAHASAQRHREG